VSEPKTYRAKVYPADGSAPIDVEYPAGSRQPTLDAIKAARKKSGKPLDGCRVEHFRDNPPGPPKP
jgi:hypothetical protein